MPATPIKLCNHRAIPSPNAPPYGNSELEKMKAKNIEAVTKITSELRKVGMCNFSGVRLIKEIPNRYSKNTNVKDANPNPQ